MSQVAYQLSDKEFNQIRDFLKKNYGISLSDEKKGLVYSRLRTRVSGMGMNFSEYYNYLIKDKTGGEEQFFINALSTNHTFFWREPDHFEYFRDHVMPWLEQTAKDKDARVWCAASSSGEEPYTLQIILHEYFKDKPGWNISILATDVSEKVLDKAVHGVYSNESVAVLPERWRKAYFKKYDAESMQVADEIRRLVTYRKFNLMDERLPFKKPFHVIFCRNVMIYFDNDSQAALVNRFYDKTVDGGFLFIGHAESLNHTNSKYKYLMPSAYRRL
ncbi:MAG: protein-glutamate O-methyltransferase CheR [Defluviitaleaceae bacterium]|nr:protein-glutamate O-methyltransferase CheR [Defluviitaleaceae bacterium]MCL2837218.1 protein-glutamate O-methyltransferase CheR [Defluviitaleaceae bacterium]